jgi:hypothetical protein
LVLVTRNFCKMFLRTRRAFEFSHSLGLIRKCRGAPQISGYRGRPDALTYSKTPDRHHAMWYVLSRMAWS